MRFFYRIACVKFGFLIYFCCICGIYAESTTAASALMPDRQPNLAHNTDPIVSALESNLMQNSFFTHRYTTRFDKRHEIIATGLYGESSVNTDLSRYSGGIISYDGVADRYPLGVFLGYAYGHTSSTTFAPTQLLTLGVFSNIFREKHHIQVSIAQGFQASNTATLAGRSLDSTLENMVFASSTNALLSYGYVFTLYGAGSFIEPYARYNLHTLFPINAQQSILASYMLRTNIDLGVRFTQFLGHHLVLSLIPAFRQDIGVIGVDHVARPIMVDPNGEIVIALPDNTYHSYATLSLGLEWRAGQACTIALKAHGVYTKSMYLYSGNLGVTILF